MKKASLHIFAVAVTVFCAVAQMAFMMPHHHHNDDVACINPLHCLSCEDVRHEDGHGDDAHSHGGGECGGHRHDGTEDNCVLTHRDAISLSQGRDNNPVLPPALIFCNDFTPHDCHISKSFLADVVSVRAFAHKPPEQGLRILEYIRSALPVRAPSFTA